MCMRYPCLMKRLTLAASGLAKHEYAQLATSTTPIKIQNFLDTLPMNWEKNGDTHRSPREALAARKAHCIEGALIAAAALWIAGEPPLLMDLWASEERDGEDHVVALYKRGAYWGAISKTNHVSLRFRDPIYRTLRELALSYFHEWFVNSTGEKTLEAYSKPYNLSRLGTGWVAAAEGLWYLDDVLNALPHYPLVPHGHGRYLRRADAMERRAGTLIEWNTSDPRA